MKMSPARRICYARDAGVCARCDEVSERWEAHHVVARADGGTDAPENLETLCPPCHLIENARQARERATRRRLGDFERKREVWDDFRRGLAPWGLPPC